MMTYSVDTILQDVRVALDMNSSGAPLVAIGDVDTLSVNEIIESKICDAVKIVHATAPLHLIESELTFGETVTWVDDSSGFVALPDDFMRLVMFEMSDWEKPVYAVTLPGTKEYDMQKSRFKGLRGTTQRPVCVLATRQEGKVIEFYSCKDDEATINTATYLPLPTISNGSIGICTRCYDAVVYTAAAMAAGTLGDANRQALNNELAKAALT